MRTRDGARRERWRRPAGQVHRGLQRWLGSVVLAGALVSPPLMVHTYPTVTTGTALESRELTADGSDWYNAGSGLPGLADVTAPASNQSGNLREVFWPEGAPSTVDEQTCATWPTESTWSVQQGAALRIRTDPDGTVHALTVTKNVFAGPTWLFSIHEWDSSADPAFHGLGTFDLSSVFRGPDGLPRPLPWRLCARVLGTRFEFKVWPAAQTTPSWGDARYGGGVDLDPSWNRLGVAGWYVGHLPPGGHAKFSLMRTWLIGTPVGPAGATD